MSCRACSLKVSQQQWEFSRRQAKIFERRSPTSNLTHSLLKVQKSSHKTSRKRHHLFSFFFFLPLRTGLHISTIVYAYKKSLTMLSILCMKLDKITTTIYHCTKLRFARLFHWKPKIISLQGICIQQLRFLLHDG